MSTIRFDDDNGNFSEINLEERGITVDDFKTAIGLVRIYSAEGCKSFQSFQRYDDRHSTETDFQLMDKAFLLIELLFDVTD